jgi:methyl-accepting chemotaxis protein
MSTSTGVQFKSMAENSAQNIMTCDANGVINYLNPESVTTLESIADLLPLAVDDIVGSSFDIFHKDPRYQQKLLKAPKKNFPTQAILDVSDEIKLDLAAAALYDDDGKFTGLQAVWSVATERLKIEADAALKTSMVEGAPTNMMTCDLDSVITYLNPASVTTLKSIENALPCKVDQIIGQKFDIFHKDPNFQQGLLSDPKRNFPRRALLNYNGVMLDLTATLVLNTSGDPIGVQAAWSIVTDQIAQEKEAALKTSMVNGASINMMTCDENGVITFLNPLSIKTLKAVESALPCRVDEIIGQRFDIFHKDPSYQQGLLTDMSRNFPRTAILDFKGVMLDLTATLINDAEGNAIGLQACWANVTEKLAQEQLALDVAEGIKENAGQVSSSATEMSASAEQMSGNVQSVMTEIKKTSQQTDTMRSQMDEVMSATTEMSSAIKEISGGAQEAAKISNEAVETAQEANSIVAALGESSAEISTVIKAISTVAQQTNLLALNATIEAARAGEAGKGFAVVASEVKELAKETRGATDDITKRIEKIQADTSRAVTSIESIAEIINRLSQIANTTASAVEEQSVTTAEMNKSIAEANAGAGEITESMEKVSAQVTEVSSGVTENADAAKALGELSEKLAALTK